MRQTRSAAQRHLVAYLRARAGHGSRPRSLASSARVVSAHLLVKLVSGMSPGSDMSPYRSLSAVTKLQLYIQILECRSRNLSNVTCSSASAGEVQ